MGQETAVREVLQWKAEFTKIQKARQHDLTEKSDVAFQDILDANFKHYKKVQSELSEIVAEDLAKAADKLNGIDSELCRQRLEKDKTLEKWQTFFAKNRAAYKDDHDFQSADRLIASAGSAKDPRMIQKYLEQARHILANSKSDKKVPAGEFPFLPSAPQTVRKADPEKVAAALKRKDLRKHIARNDTWGDFDVQKALGDKATEQDLKVLWNIVESAIRADEEDENWKQYEKNALLAIQERIKRKASSKGSADKSTTPGPETRVYKELILGAGASASYYIANNHAKFDLTSTLVIGKLQPWAEERGKEGKVNHPHNMIDPESGRKPVDEHGSLADRSEFSKRIAKVIETVPNIEAQISKVTKCKGDFFEIETNEGIFYAKTVTNAMGIGKQKEPGDPGSIESKDSVKDMDTFKRSLGDKSIKEIYKDIKSIAVVGGNAAIDVASTILRDKDVSKLEIHWIVGNTGRPAFLRGTDNALAEQAFPKEELKEEPVRKGNMTVYKGRFKSAKGAGPVEVTIEGNAVKSITVDLVVYGSGPDVEEMQKMFADETDDGKGGAKPMELESVLDKDRHYNFEIDEKDPAELIKKLGTKVSKENSAALLKYLENPDLKPVQENKDEVTVGVKSKDEEKSQASMQFVGASGARLKVAPAPSNTGKASKGLSPPAKDGLHETIASLPENVVGNDQLAASRSRIEAQSNAMPTSKDQIPLVGEPGGVSFITSNQTVIRVHIAECYPKIPPGLGDYITGQIIHARSLRPKKGDTETPIPVPRKGDDKFEDMDLKQQVAFQEKWTERLRVINGELLGR